MRKLGERKKEVSLDGGEGKKERELKEYTRMKEVTG